MTTPAAPELHLTTLGETQIVYAGRPVGEALLKKAQALLIYLAANPRAHSREALAGLLWSDMGEALARANLRTALTRIRGQMGGVLRATRQSVALTPEAPTWLDADAFERGLRAADPQARREALSLYRGDFLAGFTVNGAALFEEWALVERERLRLLAVNGIAALAGEAQQQGDLAQAVADLQWLLRLDPWREAAHRQLMRAYAARGDRAAALAQFEACRTQLQAELGVEPETETSRLYEQIKAGAAGPVGTLGPAGSISLPNAAQTVVPPAQATAIRPTAQQPGRLPAPATSFHGRAQEQAQIAAALGDPGCRMLTLTGLGGVGKTRLALEAGQRLAAIAPLPFPDGVWFVPLDGAGSQGEIVAAIASAAGFTFGGPAEPQAQLLSFLSGKSALLILDNFEHLTAHAPFLVQLLQAAPALKLLVTSRERLNLYEEWTLPLDGLPYPDTNGGDSGDYAAIELFVQRARRVNLAFDLKADAEGMRRICRTVEGLPLGIELAASWTYAFPAQEIAAAIETNLDELAAGPRNLPKRQRSLQATFDYSWELLEPEERVTLARLAVFRGGLNRTAAGQVAGATDRRLANLVEKSLVRRTPGGRYELHEQLRRFAWEKLDPPAQEAARRAHLHYFAGFLAQAEAAMATRAQGAALEQVHADASNLRAAWETALASGDFAALDRMLDVLYHYALQKGYHRQGYQDFGAAVAAVRQAGQADPENPGLERLLGRLLVRQGRCGEFTGRDLDEPRLLLEEGLALARAHRLPSETAQAQMGLGLLGLVRGQRDQATAHLEASIATCREHALTWPLASSLYLLAWIRTAAGESDQALALCAQALEIQRTQDDQNGIAGTLTTLGKIYSDRQDYAQAASAYSEALEICRRSGHRVGAAQALTGLFGASYRLGAYDQAADYARASLDLNRDAGDRLGEAIAWHNLGFVAQSQGDHPQAIEHFRQALEIYRQIGADETRIQNTQNYLEQSRATL